jgi:hypothetical protein
MAETLQHGHEKKTPNIDTQEASKRNLERLQELASKEADHDHSIDKLQASIHAEAVSAREVTLGEHRHDDNQPVLGVQKALKMDAYTRSMQKVRSNLSAPERTLSNIVHHKMVEPVSEFSSKTVARPSGILGGGIVAFVGSGVVLFLARHYGFQYNFTTFLLLLVCGFTAGIAVEYFLRFLHRKHV